MFIRIKNIGIAVGGIILCSSAAAFGDCLTNPDCAALGYTQQATECTGGQMLRCPSDREKVKCIVPSVSCEFGAVLYSNRKCYLTPPEGVIPVGVVIDSNNRVAMALDEKEFASSTSQIPSGMQLMYSIPAGEDISSFDFAVVKRGQFPWQQGYTDFDGRKATKNILDFAKSKNWFFPAYDYVYAYQPSGTTAPADWFKAGQWYLPSPKEISLITHNLPELAAALRQAGGTIFSPRLKYFVIASSSLVKDETSDDYFCAGVGMYPTDFQQSGCNCFQTLVRPVVRF